MWEFLLGYTLLWPKIVGSAAILLFFCLVGSKIDRWQERAARWKARCIDFGLGAVIMITALLFLLWLARAFT